MNYLVIGGSKGIGLEVTKKLIAEGHHVTVASRQEGDFPSEVNYVELDVLTDVSNIKNQIPAVLDGLVYCPGTINLKPFSRLSEDDFLIDYKVNVIGAVKIIQEVLPNLKASESSGIVLFSTVAARTGMSFHASVAASKAAVEGLAVSLAAEFAPFRIRVNAIAPSLTDTPLAAHLVSTQEKREASQKRHPLGRIGTASELAEAALFLLSDKSSWITGQVLGIDGGMSSIRSF